MSTIPDLPFPLLLTVIILTMEQMLEEHQRLIRENDDLRLLLGALCQASSGNRVVIPDKLKVLTPRGGRLVMYHDDENHQSVVVYTETVI